MSRRNQEPSWQPPQPVTDAPSCLGKALTFAAVVATGMTACVVVVAPSLVRGATRSDRIRLENRQAEIERVVEAETGSDSRLR